MDIATHDDPDFRSEFRGSIGQDQKRLKESSLEPVPIVTPMRYESSAELFIKRIDNRQLGADRFLGRDHALDSWVHLLER